MFVNETASTPQSAELDHEKVSRFLCEACGANMVFDVEAGGLLCHYCGHTKMIAASGEIQERDYSEFVEKGFQALQPMAVDSMQVNCESCGAIVNFTPPETATFCNFCGVKIVAQPRASDPLIAPEGVLPFIVTSKQCLSNFNAWLGSLWFAPSKLKSVASMGKMSSVYIPYWTYDADSTSVYEGERGENYTDWETHFHNGKSTRRPVTKIRWHAASGDVARSFDDVCVPATRSLRVEYLEHLEPWDLESLVPYDPAYLSGHRAQTYQLPLDSGFERFKEIAYPAIENDCRDDIGGDHQRIHNIDTTYFNVTFKHILLPIYAGAYNFEGKTHQIVINGRTGEVQGSRPYSWIKIGLLVFVIAIIIAIIVSTVGK